MENEAIRNEMEEILGEQVLDTAEKQESVSKQAHVDKEVSQKKQSGRKKSPKKPKEVKEDLVTAETTEKKLTKQIEKPRQKKKTTEAGLNQVKVEILPAKSGAITPSEVRSIPDSSSAAQLMGQGELAPENLLSGKLKLEATKQAELPFAAIKVRNIVAKIVDLTTEIIADKVIVQGIIHEQLFYVGTDELVHHLSDDIHFATFLDLPGAQPGMNAQASALIEEVISELTNFGRTIVKKFIIEIFVKVTETVQLGLTFGQGPSLLLEEVIGENTAQKLVENEVTLNTAAIKIDEIVASIRDLEVHLIEDKVIIQGNLHKQIFYVDIENLGRHQGEDIHFSLFVDLPGVQPEMEVDVCPRIEGIFFNLISPTLLRQKVVMEFFVKVTECVQQPVTLGVGPLFLVEEFIGENTVQHLSESFLDLFRPAVKVREIMVELRRLVCHVLKNKVVVQGIVHKQVFFIGTDNIEYHQAEEIPFSLFLDIPGVFCGDLCHIKTCIEGVFFELVSPTVVRQKVIFAVRVIVGREVQLNLVVESNQILYKLEEVVGENTKQILVVRSEEIVPVIPVVTTETVVFPGQSFTEEKQIIIRNTFPLPERAIKIKEILGEVLGFGMKVVPGGVLVEGEVEKQIFYVGEDDIVHSIMEIVPFSILVPVPELEPGQTYQASVEIEDISFVLAANGESVTQNIVLRAKIEGEVLIPELVMVVTDVTGPGIVTERILVEGLVLTPEGAVFKQFYVVIEVSGPGVVSVTKEFVLLQKVGAPAPAPILVVVDVQLV